MPGPTTVLNSGKTVAEICQAAELSDEALALLNDGQDGRGYVDHLVALGHYADAIRFLAHALPKRPAGPVRSGTLTRVGLAWLFGAAGSETLDFGQITGSSSRL